MQQALKSPARKAGTRIIAAELLQQLDLTTADAPQAALNLYFAGETSPSFGTALESWAGGRNRIFWPWYPP